MSRSARFCRLTANTRHIAFGLVVLALLASSATAGGYTPEEARARMTLPPGFSVEVFASEPMIRQPVAATFDERGRMWVIEYLQYPVPAGLKPVTVDQYLRTEYDRVPEPPPKGPRGMDRVKILEDTDGDGKADKVTVFVEGLNLASAIAVGRGGVFVGQAPYLLFYPDKDHDDRPDGDPQVLLKGFGLQDAHATVNSMMWGPDGWLYGAQGSTVTADIRGIGFQQGIWRYQPETDRFELFAEGGGNTWGLDFDRQGNAFGSSNGHFIMFHMVQGGYYWKGFAKHGPLHNPNTFGYFDPVAYTTPKVGGHVTPGGIIYKGDTFPTEFRGAFIGGNLLANAVYWHRLDREGSTFTGKFGGTLIDAHDNWFRPIDLLTGPDGSVFVVDWYDKRASHLDPRDNWDKTNGRIYKVTYQGTPKVEPFDLSKLSSDELVNLREKGNDWWPDMGRRLLAERKDVSILPRLRSLVAADRDETLAMRELWALDVSGGLDDATALACLDHPLAGVRRWTIRRLGDDQRMSDAIRAKLVDLATNDADVALRSQLASSCQRWKSKDALAILERLILRSEDSKDPHIPLLLWWALEKQSHSDREAVVTLLTTPSAQASMLVREHLLEREARLLASSATDADMVLCARLLSAAPGDAQTRAIVAGMDKGLEGRRLNSVPTALEQPLKNLLSQSGKNLTVTRLAVRLGSREALERAQQLAADAKLSDGDRVALIELIGQVAAPESLPGLLEMLEPAQHRPVQLAALHALGHYGSAEVAQQLLSRYPGFKPDLKDRVLDLLCTRKAWVEQLLNAIAADTVSAKDLRTGQVLQIVKLDDPALIARVEKVWGKVPAANSAEKAQRIAEVRGILPEGDKGDAARGRPVFQQTCAGCHKLFGEGESVGPDLTGIERNNLEFLLASVVDPSSVIRKEYQAQTIATTDGRVLSGLVIEETAQSLTLFDSKQQKTVIPRSQIEEQKPSTTSLMPEGLLDTLRDDQIRDLFKYIQSSGPPRR